MRKDAEQRCARYGILTTSVNVAIIGHKHELRFTVSTLMKGGGELEGERGGEGQRFKIRNQLVYAHAPTSAPEDWEMHGLHTRLLKEKGLQACSLCLFRATWPCGPPPWASRWGVGRGKNL